MMKLFRSTLGYCIAGTVVMSVWGPLQYIGMWGGFLAATIIIGPMWFMNHYTNLVGNDDDASFVDMGLAIAICGITRDSAMQGIEALISSLPTIILVTIGATLGGIAAALVEKDMAKKKDFINNNPKEPGPTRIDFEKLEEAKMKVLRARRIKAFQKNN